MELKEIVEKQREIYIKQLLEFYSNRSDGAKELLLSYSTDKPVMLLNLSRMDFILKNGDNWKIEEFSPDTYGEHPSIEFKLHTPVNLTTFRRSKLTTSKLVF